MFDGSDSMNLRVQVLLINNGKYLRYVVDSRYDPANGALMPSQVPAPVIDSSVSSVPSYLPKVPNYYFLITLFMTHGIPCHKRRYPR